MADDLNASTSLSGTFGNLALPLYEKGWRAIVPIYRDQKVPAVKEWQHSGLNPPSPKVLAARVETFADHGVGFVYGGGEVVSIDLDILDPDAAREAEALVIKILGATPLKRVGLKPKSLWLYRAATGLRVPGKNFGGFEIFFGSGQTVFYGRHPDGHDYQWLGKSPLEVSPGDLPVVTTEQIEALVDALNALTAKLPGAKPHPAGILRVRGSGPQGGETTTAPAWMVKNILGLMLNDDGDYTYDDWIAKGHAIHAATEGSEEGREIWVDWSNQQSKREKDPDQTWATLHPERSWGARSLTLEAATRVDADNAAKIAAGEEPEFKAGMNAVAAAVFDDGVDHDTDEVKAWAEAAYRRSVPRRRVEKWVGEGNPYKSMDIAQLVDAAARILRCSSTQVTMLLKVAIVLGATDLEMEEIVNALADGDAKVGKRVCKSEIKRLKHELASALRPLPNEYQAMQEEAAANAESVRQQQIAELEAAVAPLASDPNLMQRMIAYAHDEGVIGEEPAVVATFLTSVSRTIEDKAGCLTRTGAPSSGKNFVVETVLATLKDDVLLRMSSSSPLALIYHGGADNADSLKGMVVYVPEASSLLDTDGSEKPGVGILRTLISEGQVDHHVAMASKDADGNSAIETVRIVKRGPIALILTTARENIEAELRTRQMEVPADESPLQTIRVHRSQIARASGYPAERKSGTGLQDWQDYQVWLAAGAPYRVDIPYYTAVMVAFDGMPLPLRARRDISGIITGIRASTIAHRLQRKVNARGELVATIDDYKWAYVAFAPGLASVYRPQVGAEVIAVVKVVEEALAAQRAKHVTDVKAAREKKIAEEAPTDRGNRRGRAEKA